MASSSSEGESRAAVDRARHLMRRHGVRLEDLPPDVAAAFELAARFNINTASPAESARLASRRRMRRPRFSKG